jgi:carbonic anhydrase
MMIRVPHCLENMMLDSTLRRRSLFAAGGALAGSITLTSAAQAAHPAGTPLEQLLAGNRRFVSGRPKHPHQSPARIREVAAGQHPFAVILGCADSRVAPEILFDQGIGDLFDNRVAGNIVDDLLLGSIEYAVEEFTPPLIVVLGHERCGAVSATLNVIRTGGEAPGHIASIVEALRPILEPLADDPDAVEKGVQANIRAQVSALVTRSEIVAHSGAQVVGARYDLDTGRVTIVH